MDALKRNAIGLLFFIGLILAGPARSQEQAAANNDDVALLQSKIETDPDNSDLHQKYIKAVGLTNPLLERQYDAWMQKFPRSAAIPLAIGTAYYQRENPKARPYLLKVTQLDPKNAKVYSMLAIDAERWGSQEDAAGYLRKAAETEPSDPGYAFYYAMSFEETDRDMWRKKLYELAKRFPDNERGAQGLYWLAFRTPDKSEKIRVFEQLRTLYPPAKFKWSASGMTGLFDVYLNQDDPQKAYELAVAMGQEDRWPQRAAMAKKMMDAAKLFAQKKYSEAQKVIADVMPLRYSDANAKLAVVKAQIQDASGNTKAAYDSLVAWQAKTPDDEVAKAIRQYSAKLGKSETDIEAAIWEVRELASKPAPPFELGLYTSDKKTRLEDYKGKVVLLTFWFPGCGPCRGEFPHFQNVVNRFKGQDLVYLGINVFPDQDDYVLPFMEGTKYSFIPLRGTAEWAEKVYQVRGQPTNFLIDQNGKIVFSNFMINGNNERMLELMIGSMLSKGKRAM